MTSSPLIESISRLHPKKDRAAILFYFLMFCFVVFLSCLPFSATVQRTVMRKLHLTLQPFPSWAAAQFVPSMYNFQNQLFWSFEQKGTAFDSPGVPRVTVNHYPLRILYFSDNRPVVGRPLYIYLRSVYQGHEIVTSYLYTVSPGLIRAQFLNSYEFIRP